jgi:hypothetical protein
MKAKQIVLKQIMVIVAALSVGGNAASVTAQQSTPNNLFTAAGFTVRYADTPAKLAHLRRLPPDKLVTKQRGGKMYYVYADPNICRCAYVGTSEAYRAYQTGSDGSRFLSGGESIVDQMANDMTDDDMPAQPGAPSFDDYVFGGMRDD